MFPKHFAKEKSSKIQDKRIHSVWVWCTHEKNSTDTLFLLEAGDDQFTQLETHLKNKKYMSVLMQHNQVRDTVQCQRMVWAAFHPDIVTKNEVSEKRTTYQHAFFGNSTQIDHIDRNSLNNHISNLRITLPAENPNGQVGRPHLHNMRLIQDDRSKWHIALQHRPDPAWEGCEDCKAQQNKQQQNEQRATHLH